MKQTEKIICTLKEALEKGLQVGDKFYIEHTLIEKSAWNDYAIASALQSNGLFEDFFIGKSSVIVFEPQQKQDEMKKDFYKSDEFKQSMGSLKSIETLLPSVKNVTVGEINCESLEKIKEGEHLSHLQLGERQIIIIGDICTMQGEKPENHFVVVDIEDNTIFIYSNATGAIEVEREHLTIIKRGGVDFYDK